MGRRFKSSRRLQFTLGSFFLSQRYLLGGFYSGPCVWHNLFMKNNLEVDLLSEGEIIGGIVQTARHETNSQGSDIFTMSYGRKDLIMVVNKNTGSVITRVENMRELGAEENETTLLYLAAKKIMEQLAQRYKRSLVYTVSTSSETMNAWVQGKGSRIFDFQPVSNIHDEFKYHYQVIIPVEARS